MTTVKEILEGWLEEHGFDGLFAPNEECGCHRGDLLPCEGSWDGCSPGYLVRCEDCAEEETCEGAERRTGYSGCIFESRGPVPEGGDPGRAPGGGGESDPPEHVACRCSLLGLGERLAAPGAPAGDDQGEAAVTEVEIDQVRSPGGVTHAFYVGDEVTFCGARSGEWTVTWDPAPQAVCKTCLKVYKSRAGVDPPPNLLRRWP